MLASGHIVHRNSAHAAGVGSIYDRLLTELVVKMREMKMDKTELACLKAIILFNPGKILLSLVFTVVIKLGHNLMLESQSSY